MMTSENSQNLHDLDGEKLRIKAQSLERDLAIHKILLEISNAVDTTPNLTDLYASIHRALNRLIDVRNIYISIYDRERRMLHFPYFIDEADGEHSGSFRIFDEESLTGEVILKEKPLMLTRPDLMERKKDNRIVGSPSQIYLGVPLITEGEVIGVLAIQNYDDPNAYTAKDLDMLVFVSRQIAVAIERKRINDSLKENEERFRTLTEKSQDVIMRFDRSGRHLYVNPAIENLGYSPREMIGKTHRDLDFPVDLVEMWESTINDVFETRQVSRIEFKLPQNKWIDWLLCPEFSSDNQVNSVITFARDITERKQRDFHNYCYDKINKIIIDATDLEQMLNRILDTMNDIFDSDRAWILFPCNPDASQYEVPFLRCKAQWYVPPGDRFEITPEAAERIREVIQSDDPVTFDPESRQQVRSDVRKQRHVKSQITLAVFPKTGDAWQVGLHQCSYDRVWTGRESSLFKGICRRIADGLSSMLLYRELQQAKRYIDNVVDSMPSILIGVDYHGLVTQWNAKAESITNASEKETIGNSFVSFFPHLAGYEAIVKKAIGENKPIEKRKVPYTEDGQIRYHNITIYPLQDTDIKGAVIKLDDVTEQVQIEEMMIQSEKMLSVGGLAAGMAHEINNPLAGMMQNAQVLLNRLTTDIPANVRAAREAGATLDVIKQYMHKRKIIQQLEHIHDAGKRAAQVVENMLSFAKKAEGAKEYVDLENLVKKTIDLAQNDYDLKNRFDFKQIGISHIRQDDFPMVLCETSKIQQVFLNIIKNGAEAMAEFCPDSNRKSAFIIRYSRKADDAVVEIEDNGPGMEEAVKKRVFEPFFTTKPVDKGTGLGLSVAYFIVCEDHKGELSVDSEKGKGSVFMIRLPIHG